MADNEPNCCMCGLLVVGPLIAIRGMTGNTICEKCITSTHGVLIEQRAKRTLKSELAEENKKLREQLEVQTARALQLSLALNGIKATLDQVTKPEEPKPDITPMTFAP
jgi:spore cortex formation protein SpoVR/YcgB (stage V sporulation)